ncbi:MAG: ester cyclase [bacterium]
MRTRMLLFVVGLALALSGCKKKPPKADKTPEDAPQMAAEMSPEEGPEKKPARPGPRPAAVDKVAVLKAGFAAYNAGKDNDMIKELPDNVTWIVGGIGALGVHKGKARIKAYFAGVRKTFPDGKVTPERYIDTGNVVVVQAVFTGTQEGPFMGKPASNKTIGLPTVYWTYWNGGKLAKLIQVLDLPTMMRQMGLMPVMPGMPAPPVLAAPTGAAEVIKGKPNGKLEALYRKLVSLKSGDAELAKGFVKDVKLRGANGLEINSFVLYKKILAMDEKAYPDLKAKVVQVVAVGDWYAGMIKVTGTNKGPIGKMKPTGQTIQTSVCHVAKVKDGKIVLGYGYSNSMAVLMQLGLIPIPGAAKPPKKAAKKGK